MASQAVPSHGTLLQRSDGVGGWTTIAEQTVVDLTLQRDEADISIHNEPLSAKNFIAGPLSGEVALTANFLSSDPTHANILSLFLAGDKALWRVLYNTQNPPTAFQFEGFPRQFNIPAPAGTAAAIQFSTVIRVDGSPLWY